MKENYETSCETFDRQFSPLFLKRFIISIRLLNIVFPALMIVALIIGETFSFFLLVWPIMNFILSISIFESAKRHPNKVSKVYLNCIDQARPVSFCLFFWLVVAGFYLEDMLPDERIMALVSNVSKQIEKRNAKDNDQSNDNRFFIEKGCGLHDQE